MLTKRLLTKKNKIRPKTKSKTIRKVRTSEIEAHEWDTSSFAFRTALRTGSKTAEARIITDTDYALRILYLKYRIDFTSGQSATEFIDFRERLAGSIKRVIRNHKE